MSIAQQVPKSTRWQRTQAAGRKRGLLGQTFVALAPALGVLAPLVAAVVMRPWLTQDRDIVEARRERRLDTLHVVNQDEKTLDKSQLKHAGELCGKPEKGSKCEEHVMWAKMDGVKTYPQYFGKCMETSHHHPTDETSHHSRRLSSHSDKSEMQEATFDLTSEEGREDCLQCELHLARSWECKKPCDPAGKKPHCGLISGHEEHDHGYIALLFLLVGLTTGCVLQTWQERHLPQVPYTCLLFLAGLGFAGIHKLRHVYTSEKNWGNWFKSVEMWEKVNPHLVFYIFLPLLIFAEAMKLNIPMAKRIFGQVLVMATIGVLIGTGLTALYAKFCLPYHWEFPAAILFGSILSATDPVAVVALFNTLGVSPKLTMLISGESLLNDGTAIVVFQLVMIWATGGALSPALIAVFSIKMILLSVLLGILLAFVALVIISWCAEAGYHTDAMIQVCITLLLSMFCFFLAESEAGGWTPKVDGTEIATSGVLTVVSAGCCVSYFAWPAFVSREVMHTVWEAVEFIGNTVVFLLAGLLWGHEILDDYHLTHISGWDVLHLLGLYAALHVIRGIMICFFWPFLLCIGMKITWKEVIVMSWSGLRGAVGLILAIIVDERHDISKKMGAQFLFHIGGIAMMTIGINATLCPFLLSQLNLTRPKGLSKLSAQHFEQQLREYAKTKFEELSESEGNARWKNVSFDDVKKLLPLLQHSHKEAVNDKPVTQQAELRAYRGIFLRFLQKEYWNYVEEGQIPKKGRVARVLLMSCSDALLRCDSELSDWKSIQAKSGEWQLCPCINDCLEQIWPFSQWYWIQAVFPSKWTVSMWKAYLSMCFLEAHAKARDKIPPFFDGSQVFQQDTMNKVREESEEQSKLAREWQKEEDDDDQGNQKALQHAKNRMFAGRLLMKKREETELCTRLGVLPDKAASHLLHELHHQSRQLTRGNMYEPE